MIICTEKITATTVGFCDIIDITAKVRESLAKANLCNGFAHLRASLVGPSLSIPVQNCQPLLGTWQQVVLIDFDNRPRSRDIIAQFIGETA